ncbi:MAG TPA: hypothetical protein VGC39_07140, partial [Candidatus Methylacidiphilales bacterium]
MKSFAAIVTILFVFAGLTQADTSWTGTAADNNFNNPANWTAGVPNAATNAQVTAASGDTLTVGSSISTAALSGTLANNLTLNTSAGVTLGVTGNADLTGAGSLVKGGTGALTLSGAGSQINSLLITGGQGNQTAGATSLNELAVGTGTADVGSFNLSNGAITVGATSTLAGSFRVGDFGGTGTFAQTGGSMTVNGSFDIGNQGGNGVYNISGGTLALNNGLFSLGRTTSSAASAGTGQLNISGGAVAVTGTDAHFVIGDRDSTGTAGVGTLTQTGGTFTFTPGSGAELFLAGYGVGNVYNLNGGMLQIGGTSLNGRYGNTGTYQFNLGGGTIQVIGTALNTNVAATLTAGTASTVDTNGLGANFTGALTGTGGLIKAGAGDLTLNNAANSIGSLQVNQGNVDQAGGITAIGTLNLAQAGTAYNLNSGTLQVGGANGITGIGTLNLGGGTLQVVGSALTSNTPTVLVTGTTSTINTTAFDATLNDMSGSGSLNKIGGNYLNLGGAITLGAGASINSQGALSIGTLTAAGTLTLNAGSTAVFTGQSATGHGSFLIGYGNTGTLNLAGGAVSLRVLDSNAQILVGEADGSGNAGHGTVNFSSGSILFDESGFSGSNYGLFVVGNGANSVGTVNQSGGTVTGVNGNGVAFEIGVGGATGTYAMTNNASVNLGTGNTIYIGDSAGGTGLVHISGNSTFSSTSGRMFLGTSGGTGTIEQDGAGSVVTITNGALEVDIGEDSGSTGNYDLSNGQLNIVSGAIAFGDSAGSRGNLNQTG